MKILFLSLIGVILSSASMGADTSQGVNIKNAEVLQADPKFHAFIKNNIPAHPSHEWKKGFCVAIRASNLSQGLIWNYQHGDNKIDTDFAMGTDIVIYDSPRVIIIKCSKLLK